MEDDKNHHDSDTKQNTLKATEIPKSSKTGKSSSNKNVVLPHNYNPKTHTSSGKKRFNLISLKDYPVHKITIEEKFDDGFSLQELVNLPTGEDRREWIACHTTDFLHQLQWLYGTILDDCTSITCPIMTAGPGDAGFCTEYKWQDEHRLQPIGRTIKLPAVEYCARLFQWVKDQTDDEQIFPSKIGDPWCQDFEGITKKIFTRLFRVYGHVYHSHLDTIIAQKQAAHLNASFKHFILFVKKYNLVEKEDLKPLSMLIDKIYKEPAKNS